MAPWKRYYDPVTKHTFYVNDATGEGRHDTSPPTALTATQQQQHEAALAAARQEAAAAQANLVEIRVRLQEFAARRRVAANPAPLGGAALADPVAELEEATDRAEQAVAAAEARLTASAVSFNSIWASWSSRLKEHNTACFKDFQKFCADNNFRPQ